MRPEDRWQRPPKREAAGRVRLAVDDFEAGLSTLAQRSAASRGRELSEAPCLVRTPFQRDRDRIVHSKAFRRLKHKTQVFIDPEGDHFRTRLTHTLEATGIARTVARALRLNEDLTEAVGLGHDLGHTPFGHAGEEALNEVLRELGAPTPFRHNEQSLRVVEQVENEGRGLNLTWEVRDGILHHTGPRAPATLEARIVKICDRVAYINHDIDDALRAGLLTDKDLPGRAIGILGPTTSERIDVLVHDLVDASEVGGDILQSPPVEAATNELRDFLFARVYARSIQGVNALWVRQVVADLLRHFLAHPRGGAEGAAAGLVPPAPPELQTAVDHVAGMTDRYAERVWREIAGR